MPKQTTNVSGNPYGIQYTAAGETWTIAKGVDVFGNSVGIYSQFVNNTLVNQGEVTGGAAGVGFAPGGASGAYAVTNKASGQIGGQYALYLSNFLGSFDLDNDGEITGSIAGLYSAGSSDVEILNSGEISGGSAGIFVQTIAAGASGPVINNYGTIESGQYAIYLLGDSTLKAKVVNHAGGKIEGPLALGSGFQLDFKNEGKVVGDVFSGTGADKVINKAKINGDVLLGEGVDTFKQNGDKAKAGLIDTQGGNDLVVLGNKADKLLFDSTLNAATNVDTIKKFVSGKDAVFLDDDIFSAITPGTLSSAAFHQGTSAADADDRIIYDKASGALYYDPDGLGGVAQTQFAKFDGGPKLKAADFTIGEYTIVII